MRRDLLGAYGGLLREVVVGVVSLSDATEQHRHHACREGRQTHTRARSTSQRHHTHTQQGAGYTLKKKIEKKI